MSLTKPKILYFISGPVASATDLLAVSELNATIQFRNAEAVSLEDTILEPCDGVAGDVPSNYAEQFPTAEEAIEKYEAAIAELRNNVGDEAAPKIKRSRRATKDEAVEQIAEPPIPDWKPE